MSTIRVNAEDAKNAVSLFNSRYADMEAVLWKVSRVARDHLLIRKRSQVLEELVWTIKSWWGVQGVEKNVKVIAPDALLDLNLQTEVFEEGIHCFEDGEAFAHGAVQSLVQGLRERGARRREWSLASKALHWVLPWRIPVYDSFVCKSLGIFSGTEPYEAYSRVVQWEFEVARSLVAEDSDWLGDIEPKTPFRAIDKYLWWLGGGSSDSAVVVKDPRAVLRKIGLE
jgi:hypothetical protein